MFETEYVTSVKEAMVGAAMNTTNGAYSAVLSTFSAYNRQQQPHQYYFLQDSGPVFPQQINLPLI